ncbi:MAG TPA: hypothetical protein VFZ58_05720 [Candidatus Saccharimonadales bacterium]
MEARDFSIEVVLSGYFSYQLVPDDKRWLVKQLRDYLAGVDTAFLNGSDTLRLQRRVNDHLSHCFPWISKLPQFDSSTADKLLDDCHREQGDTLSVPPMLEALRHYI